MNSPFSEPDKESSEKYHEILEEIFKVFRDSVKERRKFTEGHELQLKFSVI